MQDLKRSFATIAVVLVALILGACQTISSLTAVSTPPSAFEVWAADQSDTDPAGGGRLYIWNGAELSRNASRARPEVIDLAKAARAAGCKPGKRPHMLMPNYTEPPSHVIIAHTASHSLFFVRVKDRRITGCLEIDAHSATATPDNRVVITANIGEQLLTKVRTNYENEDFEAVEELSLDKPGILEALGTETAGPICLEFTEDSRYAYVTLKKGGLLVIDVGSPDGTKPMRVVKVYPAATVPGIGCGAFRMPDGNILTNGESGAKGGDDFLYIFDASGTRAGVFPDPVQIELPGEDTHAVALCTDRTGRLFAVTAMRVSNDINVVDLQAQKVVATSSMARPFSPDPKPDVGYIVGNRLFIALRGPKPLTAIGALKNANRTPGVAVLTFDKDCRSFNWEGKDIASMSDPTRTKKLADRTEVTAADPHGLVMVPR